MTEPVWGARTEASINRCTIRTPDLVCSEHGWEAFATEERARAAAGRQEARGMTVEWGRRGDAALFCTSEWIDSLMGNPGWIVVWRSPG